MHEHLHLNILKVKKCSSRTKYKEEVLYYLFNSNLGTQEDALDRKQLRLFKSVLELQGSIIKIII
jgi:hypothetical protein